MKPVTSISSIDTEPDHEYDIERPASQGRRTYQAKNPVIIKTGQTAAGGGVLRRFFNHPCYLIVVPLSAVVSFVSYLVWATAHGLVNVRLALIIVAVMQAATMVRRGLMLLLRYTLLYFYVGWSREMVLRNVNQTPPVNQLSEEESRKCSNVDALIRRIEQIYHSFRGLIVTHVLTGMYDRLFVYGLALVLNIAIRSCALLQASNACIKQCGPSYATAAGGIRSCCFPGARCKDGTLAYWNIMHSQVWTKLGIICADVLIGPMLIASVTHSLTLRNMGIFWWLIACWGDAAAELVGTFYGKHRFNVYGVGDINSKSIEGCIAFVVFSFSAVVVALKINHLLTWHYVMLTFICSIVGMFFETWSPRSTDNFTILVSVALTVYTWEATFG